MRPVIPGSDYIEMLPSFEEGLTELEPANRNGTTQLQLHDSAGIRITTRSHLSTNVHKHKPSKWMHSAQGYG